MSEPAIVYGDMGKGYADFVEDSHGNLADILFYCPEHIPEDLSETPQWWPAFDFGESGAFCEVCAVIIQTPRAEV